MSTSPPDVSVVFETENEAANHSIRLPDVMRAWLRQTALSRVAEWIVISSRPPLTEEIDLLRQGPGRWIECPESRYYGQKNEGVRQASKPFIALADSDAVPADDWLERALYALETGGPSIAIVTGRTRYAAGPFSREMAIAQLPNQQDQPHDTTHFLAHNALLRCAIVRERLFADDKIRQGSDTYLAAQLIRDGFRVRYDPSLCVTHNYSTHPSELYRHCLVIGYAYGRFQENIGEPHPNRLWDFVGRVRTLLGRWRDLHRPLGLSLWRLPMSLLFFVTFAIAIANGYEMAVRGAPEPFARF